jgi:hypothetical protein
MVSRFAIFMASSMATMSTEDIGLKAQIRWEDRDRRLLDILDWEDRPEATEDVGDMDRGVEISGLAEVLWAFDAIACGSKNSGKEREKKSEFVELSYCGWMGGSLLELRLGPAPAVVHGGAAGTPARLVRRPVQVRARGQYMGPFCKRRTGAIPERLDSEVEKPVPMRDWGGPQEKDG